MVDRAPTSAAAFWRLPSIREVAVRALVRRARPGWTRSLLEADLADIETFAPPRLLAPPVEPGKLAIVAPHPDDESIGCGGLALAWRRGGGTTRVYFLTRGERGDPRIRNGAIPRRQRDAYRQHLIKTREGEANAAVGVLGAEAEWLPGRDGELHAGVDALAGTLAKRWQDQLPDAIAAPFPFDRHSDHAAAARIVAKASAVLPGNTPVWSYEVWSPAIINAVLDITDVADEKRRAIESYASQLATTNYLVGAEALNRFRAVASGLGNRIAEGYYLTSVSRYKAITDRLEL